MMKNIICWNVETLEIWKKRLNSDESVQTFQVKRDLDRDRFEIVVTAKN